MQSSGVSDPSGSEPAKPGARHGAAPLLVVLGALTGLGLLVLANQPVRDVDLYWHVVAGWEILQNGTARGLGADWTFAQGLQEWVSTQWVSEIFLATLQDSAGWAGVAAFVVLSTAAVLAILSRYTLFAQPPVLSAWPFLLAGVAVVLAADARSQQVTLVGAALLGGVLLRGLSRGLLPRWWIAVPLVAVWANAHGGWILAPVTIGLIGVKALIEEGIGGRLFRRSMALSLGLVVAGSISPSGLTNPLAFLRFAEAASQIKEWQRVVPFSPIGALVLAMGALLVLAWVRTPPVGAADLIVGGFLGLLALSAGRNVAPALLLAAPLVAERLAVAFPAAQTRTEPRWSAWGGVGLAAALTLVAVPVAMANSDPQSRGNPVGLALIIKDRGQPERVLNDYNAAGVVLYFGGPNVRVAIDGRTDLYGAEYIARHLSTLDLKGDFEAELDRLDPTIALLSDDSPMVWYLAEHRGWDELGREGDWVLLARPEPKTA